MEAGRILFSSFSMKLSKWFRKEINVSADTAARAVGLATAAKLIEWVNDARLDLNAVIESISRWLTSGIM
jgi:hypothetical protein